MCTPNPLAPVSEEHGRGERAGREGCYRCTPAQVRQMKILPVSSALKGWERGTNPELGTGPLRRGRAAVAAYVVSVALLDLEELWYKA
jgi:hypothetical protein